MMNITVPDIGDFDAVEIIEILVGVGDQVEKESTLVTLESDKATMEIPCPESGKVTEILVSIGDKVAEGTLIVKMDTAEPTTELSESSEQTRKITKEPKIQATQPRENITVDAEQQAPAKIEATTESQTIKAEKPAPTKSQVHSGNDRPPHASPSVRRFAREIAADLTKISGTGSKNRILKEDVKKWVSQRLHGAEKSTTQAGIPPIPEIDFSEFGETEILKLSRIKKLSGSHLQRAWLNIPHVTHNEAADITELETFRKSLKEEATKQDLKITLLSFVMKALAVTMKKFPTFNASLEADGQQLILKKYFNIGVAVDTLDGLVVPVIRDVNEKSIFDLAQDLEKISTRARNNKLTPDDIKGGCISISSLGGLGGISFSPIINAPEVAILGLSRAKTQPVWDGKTFQPRLMLPLSLSYDHRVVDGAEAARFCIHLADTLSDIRRLVL